MLCKYKKRAQYLDAITNDKKNGVLANGSAELLLSQLAEIEISVLEEMINTDLFVKELPFDVPQLIQ